jgi:hypothetical protein
MWTSISDGNGGENGSGGEGGERPISEALYVLARFPSARRNNSLSSNSALYGRHSEYSATYHQVGGENAYGLAAGGSSWRSSGGVGASAHDADSVGGGTYGFHAPLSSPRGELDQATAQSQATPVEALYGVHSNFDRQMGRGDFGDCDGSDGDGDGDDSGHVRRLSPGCKVSNVRRTSLTEHGMAKALKLLGITAEDLAANPPPRSPLKPAHDCR